MSLHQHLTLLIGLRLLHCSSCHACQTHGNLQSAQMVSKTIPYENNSSSKQAGHASVNIALSMPTGTVQHALMGLLKLLL